MNKIFLFFFTAFLSAQFAMAQQKTISGQVVDTFNNETLEYATVAVLRASDSVLLGYARTDTGGRFSLTVAESPSLMLLVTCPGFADFIEIVPANTASTMNLGKLPLYTRERLLSEFVVHQKRGAILIKGDTTEYLADSFKVDANANVEQLLKKLPGLQVDKDGQITAQGEKVQKILVDGEEFFSDDPAVVNRNLQAKTIDKVQVFDKKSENTEFTGIDDGERTKTINLQLKDKYKKGYFGKVALGGGNDGFFENQGMFNMFHGKQKFAVYGIAANTGKVGLSYQDNSKFGNGGNSFMDEDAGIAFSTGGDDEDANWSGNYTGKGLPSAWTAGAHFSDKWNEDKHHLSLNYRFNRKNIETVNNTLTQYSLPDSVYYNDQKEQSFSSSDRHGITSLYEYKIDSSNTLKFTADAAQVNKRSNSTNNTDTKGGSGGLINNSLRKMSNEGTDQSLNAALIWKRRFKKKGRNLLLEADIREVENKNDGYLLANNSFFTEGVKDSVTAIDQLKQTKAQTSSLAANITYTEPISAKGFLEVQYRFNNQNNFSRQLSFNKDIDNDYKALDTLTSADYDFDVNTHRAGASLRWVYEKMNFSFGAAAANTNFLQTDNIYNTVKKRNYNNFFPSAHINYKFSKQTSLYVSYRGSTSQPTISQLQPLRQNTDPLNISIGNPNLRQSFTNSFSFRYNSYKVLKGTYYYASGGTNFVHDAISTSQDVLASGIRSYQYVNVGGNYNMYLYAGVGYRLAKLHIDYGFYGNASRSRTNNIINGLQNKNDVATYGLSGRLSYDKDKKFNISFEPSITYNDNKSSISNVNTGFWSTKQDLSATVYLPLKFQIVADISWNVRQRTVSFDQNNNVFQANASLSKKFLKSDELELKFSVFDIFNQNLGFSRYGQDNMVTQQSYNTIRRYGLLSVIWNFTHAPKAQEPAASDIIEIDN